MKSGDAITIEMQETSAASKGKEPLIPAPLPPPRPDGRRKGIAIFDFILRICAIVTALATAASMGTSEETLPFFTQFFQFQASYDDIPTFE